MAYAETRKNSQVGPRPHGQPIQHARADRRRQTTRRDERKQRSRGATETVVEKERQLLEPLFGRVFHIVEVLVYTFGDLARRQRPVSLWRKPTMQLFHRDGHGNRRDDAGGGADDDVIGGGLHEHSLMQDSRQRLSEWNRLPSLAKHAEQQPE